MNHIKTFESFLNEANLSQEFMKFQPGDAVIINKAFKPTDLNFRNSARTWWGEKVASLKNMWAKEIMKFSPDREYKSGEPLFVFTRPSKIDSKGFATIFGYAGFFFGLSANKGQSPDEFALEAAAKSYDYNEMMTQTIILAILGGYATVKKYSDISQNIRNEFEAEVKLERITSEILKKNTVIYDGMEIHKYEWAKTGYIFSGFDVQTGNEVPNKLVKFEDIVKGKFVCNGNELTSNPF